MSEDLGCQVCPDALRKAVSTAIRPGHVSVRSLVSVRFLPDVVDRNAALPEPRVVGCRSSGIPRSASRRLSRLIPAARARTARK